MGDTVTKCGSVSPIECLLPVWKRQLTIDEVFLSFENSKVPIVLEILNNVTVDGPN
jgi:hypothetical protein